MAEGGRNVKKWTVAEAVAVMQFGTAEDKYELAKKLPAFATSSPEQILNAIGLSARSVEHRLLEIAGVRDAKSEDEDEIVVDAVPAPEETVLEALDLPQETHKRGRKPTNKSAEVEPVLAPEPEPEEENDQEVEEVAVTPRKRGRPAVAKQEPVTGNTKSSSFTKVIKEEAAASASPSKRGRPAKSAPQDRQSARELLNKDFFDDDE